MSHDEHPDTREEKEKGLERGNPTEQSSPPPGGWADRDEKDPDPRDPDDD
jgi:hypothetical protein